MRIRKLGKPRTHGFTAVGDKKKNSFVRVWYSMRERCGSPKAADYRYYGGRGITVCDRWQKFENFRDDMWEGYASFGEKPTLERFDVNGNYELSNCGWATRAVQANNARSNHGLTLFGETKNITQWAKFLGCPPSRIHNRLKLGWDVEEALLEPLR